MIPSPRNEIRSSAAMPTSTRGLDPQPLAGAQGTGGLGRQLVAVQEIAPRLARFAAVRTARPVSAAFREERELHLAEGLQLADHAVPAAVASRAARVAA